MDSVIDILEQLEQASGSNAKKDILLRHKDNALLKQAFVATGDPYTVYYVLKFKMPAALEAMRGTGDDQVMEGFLDGITRLLATRQLTGNTAKDWVSACFAQMTPTQQKWCLRILLRNLRVGVQQGVLGNVWPGLVKGFSVALATTIKSEFIKGQGIKLLETIDFPVRVEPKLDGFRCIAVKRAGKVTFYTRNGTVLDSPRRIKTALEAGDYDDVVLDGELMSLDWSQTASVVMSLKTHKDDSELVYHAFDAMPLADWAAQETALPYGDRVEIVSLVRRTLRPEGRECIHQVPHIIARDEAQLKQFFAECLDDGFEGVMLKTLDAPYVWKRSDNIRKLKPTASTEGTIVGWYKGRAGTKREGLFGGFEVVFSNGIVTHVGGGFSDALKAEVQLNGPDTYVGRLCECEFQPDPVSLDGFTEDGKLRFPVLLRFRPEGDVDPKIVEAGKRFLER